VRSFEPSRVALALLSLGVAACAAKSPQPTTPAQPPESQVTVERAPDMPRESPPVSAPARDIAFPPIHHAALDNGLAVDVVSHKQLPIVSIELVIRSGSTADPKDLPGLASAVADMLREGTVKKPGAKFVEAVEYLGANLHTSAGQETVRIGVSAMSEHFDAALALLAEAALMPAFNMAELEKLKKRTLDDLKQKKDRPVWLARRELHQALYGDHPYARIDATESAVKKLKRTDLTTFHSAHFAPNNAFLVVVGNVTPEQVEAASRKAFGTWRKKDVQKPTYAAPAERTSREVVVVDRPASVQSQIVIGNLALKRNDPRFIPLMVANQVLGGSAASRLFMDLREKRSLTYGAYSRIDETVDLGSFRASAAVRTEVTEQAVDAFFEHLNGIVQAAPPQAELAAAHRYLADSFPLAIETVDRIADLVSDLRVYGLPDDYWDTFRSNIRKVTPDQALAAAREFVHPEKAVVVVVGRAADVVPALQKLGPVRVVDVNGAPLTGGSAQPSAPAAAPTSATQAAPQGGASTRANAPAAAPTPTARDAAQPNNAAPQQGATQPTAAPAAPAQGVTPVTTPAPATPAPSTTQAGNPR
jgi:zinc protease